MTPSLPANDLSSSSPLTSLTTFVPYKPCGLGNNADHIVSLLVSSHSSLTIRVTPCPALLCSTLVSSLHIICLGHLNRTAASESFDTSVEAYLGTVIPTLPKSPPDQSHTHISSCDPNNRLVLSYLCGPGHTNRLTTRRLTLRVSTPAYYISSTHGPLTLSHVSHTSYTASHDWCSWAFCAIEPVAQPSKCRDTI